MGVPILTQEQESPRPSVLQASFRFQEGATQEFTANAVQRVIENNIEEVLASAVGEIRADAEDGCSANAIITGQVGDSFAMCDVSVSADSILVQIDAVADVGAASCLCHHACIRIQASSGRCECIFLYQP